MKFSASKRVVFILIICFILLLLGGMSLYFKDVISNGIKYGRWFTVDRYEELFDYCEWEKERGELKIKCKALVKSMSVSKENKKNICYDILIISKVDSSLIDYKICEEPGKIDFNNPFKILNPFDANDYLPVVLTFVGNVSKNKHLALEKIKISVNSQDELDELLLNDRLINNLNVARIGLVTNMIYNNFIIRNSSLFPSISLKEISLYNLKLKNITKDIDEYRLMFSGLFEFSSKPYEIILDTKGFAFSVNDKTSYLEKEDITTLQIDKTYHVDLIYSLEDLSESNNKLIEFCSMGDKRAIERKSLCSLLGDNTKIESNNSIQTDDDLIKFVVNNSGKVIENITITKIINLGF